MEKELHLEELDGHRLSIHVRKWLGLNEDGNWSRKKEATARAPITSKLYALSVVGEGTPGLTRF